MSVYIYIYTYTPLYIELHYVENNTHRTYTLKVYVELSLICKINLSNNIDCAKYKHINNTLYIAYITRIYIYTYIYTYIYISTYIYVYVYIFWYMYNYVYIYIYIYIYIQIYIYTYRYTYRYTYIYMQIWWNIYVHTYTNWTCIIIYVSMHINT